MEAIIRFLAASHSVPGIAGVGGCSNYRSDWNYSLA
jgi:hypothetical protein